MPGMTAASRFDALLSGELVVPVNELLGFTFQPVPDPTERVILSWTVPAAYCNSEGNLQGGMYAAFADAALGAASAAHLPPEEYPALAEMKISIYRPARAGSELTVEGRVVKKGRRVMFVEASITDASGTLIAGVTGTSLPVAAS